MTYCFAWKTSDAVFLAADSAVQSTIAVERSAVTSFGERTIRKDGRHVYEGALKIFRLGNAALTFTGDADTGYSFVRNIATHLNAGTPILEAFKHGASSICAPPLRPKIRAIGGYFADDVPHLIVFNASGSGEFSENENLVQFGLRDIYREQVATFTTHLERNLTDPRDRMACIIGFCQSIGVREYLLEQGVGGPFCGAFLTKTGFEWLPDMSFHLLSGRPEKGESFDEGEVVVSVVRDDIFLVGSPYTGGFTTWYNSGLVEPTHEEIIRNAKRVGGKAQKLARDQAFDYSVLISKDTAVTVVVRMDKKRITKHLGHNLKRSPRSDRITMMTSGFSSELGGILKREGLPSGIPVDIPYLQFIPFQPGELGENSLSSLKEFRQDPG